MARSRPVQRLLALLLAALVGLPLGLVLGELVARRIEPPPRDYYVWQPGMERVFRPLPGIMPGIEGPSVFRISSVGLRGDEPSPSDQLRILTVGGSTTECLYLDQGEAWPQVLQDLLGELTGRRVWIGNAGRSGHTTREHVFQVRHLVEHEPHPDVLLILAGVNDLAGRLSQGEAYDPLFLERPGAEAWGWNAAFSVVPDGPRSPLPWHKQTALFRLARRVKNRLFPDPRTQQETGEVYLDWRERRRNAGVVHDELPDLTAALEEYRRNLTTCVHEAQAAGVRVALLDQPALWREDLPEELARLLWMGGVGRYYEIEHGEYYSPGALARGMALYNDVVREVAAAEGADLVSLAADLPQDTSVFYDDVHYNEAGARRVAQLVAQRLVAVGAVSVEARGQ